MVLVLVVVSRRKKEYIVGIVKEEVRCVIFCFGRVANRISNCASGLYRTNTVPVVSYRTGS